MNRKIVLIAVVAILVVTVTIGLTLSISEAFRAESRTSTLFDHSKLAQSRIGYSFGVAYIDLNKWGFKGPIVPTNRGWFGNLTINADQARAIVEADIPNFKIGTISSSKMDWIIPIEDDKGVVLSIRISKISAPTVEQARSIVEESLKKGWSAGEPKLMGTIYIVPIIDSNNLTIGYVMVDGKSGEILRRPSTILKINSEQAKTIVNNAIKEFKVGEVKDRVNVWVVGIKYKDKVIMNIILAKLNTPTSEDAKKVVEESLKKGWSAGEPKQLRFIYNVPIIDYKGNTIGNVKVDGKTGEIMPIALPPLRK
ncbi:MAG: hypothetical protein QW372_03925 [Nitrososphaerales archaeon]